MRTLAFCPRRVDDGPHNRQSAYIAQDEHGGAIFTNEIRREPGARVKEAEYQYGMRPEHWLARSICLFKNCEPWFSEYIQLAV